MAKNVSINKEGGNPRFKNTTGANIVQFQLVVICGFVAIALEDIANGAIGAFDVRPGIVVRSASLTPSEGTFATVSQDVFLDASGNFSDTRKAGYQKVGVLNVAKDSDGVIEFTTIGRAIPSNSPIEISGTPTNNDTLKFVTSTGLWTVVPVAD